MPKPLDGSDHYTDLAMAPMQMLTAPYVESHLSPNVSTKLAKLYSPHMYTAQALSYPYDVRPRNYTFWVDDGWSIGGVEFDESEVGGPSINQPSFSPGVILWDAGKGGTGVGYISVGASHLTHTTKTKLKENAVLPHITILFYHRHLFQSDHTISPIPRFPKRHIVRPHAIVHLGSTRLSTVSLFV